MANVEFKLLKTEVFTEENSFLVLRGAVRFIFNEEEIYENWSSFNFGLTQR